MDVEARGGGAALKDSCRAKVSYRTTLALAYQSFGVVYGDLSTSPLYVYKSTFSGKLKLREHDDEILGVLSFIFWTFMLVTLCKYIFFVLTADDNGEVLSAVQGIKVKADLDDRYIVLIACVILVGLFALQHFGTRKVGFLFAPIVIAWILCISSIGIYNIIRWNPTVFRAISPYYMFNFFRKTKVDGWESLGGIVLCITGAEAMFADLGHFSQLSIKIAFTGVVYPCLILAYMGDAAFLSKHKGDLQRSFYMSIPEAVFWPVFVVATLAAVVGSQAVISATFSIINQCSALSCFPRVKVVHTSNQIYGQNCARPAI